MHLVKMKIEKEKILNGLSNGIYFFSFIKEIGTYILGVISVISIMLMLVIMAFYHPEFKDVIIVMLKIIRIGGILYLMGLLFAVLLKIISDIIYNKQMKVYNVKKSGRKKRNK